MLHQVLKLIIQCEQYRGVFARKSEMVRWWDAKRCAKNEVEFLRALDTVREHVRERTHTRGVE